MTTEPTPSGQSKPPAPALEEATKGVRLVFGLKQQGHIPTIEKMLTEGKTWDEIGKVIGWEPSAAEKHYARYEKYYTRYISAGEPQAPTQPPADEAPREYKKSAWVDNRMARKDGKPGCGTCEGNGWITIRNHGYRCAECSEGTAPAPAAPVLRPLEEFIPELLELARGEDHDDDGCPQDDTCRCENIATLNRELKAIQAMRAAPAPAAPGLDRELVAKELRDIDLEDGDEAGWRWTDRDGGCNDGERRLYLRDADRILVAARRGNA